MSRSVITHPARTGRAAGAPGPVRVLRLASLLIAAIGLMPQALAADPPPADDKEPAPAEKPLRFTDEDLEKYRKPSPAPGAEAVAPASDAKAPKPAAVPATAKGTSGARPAPPKTLEPVPKPAPGATPSTLAPPAAPLRPATAPRPIPAAGTPVVARPPAEDPLKRWKDRDALETFRQQQIEDLRGQIAALQGRLDYLKAKENGLLNPTSVEVGRTVGPDYGPGGKPDTSPGRPQPKVAPIFPALPPPQTDEDRQDDKSLKIKDLLEKVRAEMETAEADLKQAKDALITIETRFAQESGRP